MADPARLAGRACPGWDEPLRIRAGVRKAAAAGMVGADDRRSTLARSRPSPVATKAFPAIPGRPVAAAPAPILTTAAELESLVADVRAAGRLALDTEFVWERTYRPELGVIQLATNRRVAVIDAVAVRDLSTL